MSLWKSNLILSDIPWDYYLHPCPKFYGWELAKHGYTLWINPPTRNPFKVRLIRPTENLIVFTPWILNRPFNEMGFNCKEVRIQIRLASKAFIKKVSSVWSISTAYSFLLRDFPLASSIFWSGDFFDPISEFASYKKFDLVLCLTPPKFEKIPKSFKGKKLNFNMSCDLNVFNKDCDTEKICEHFAKFSSNGLKIVGYIGTLSTRRVNYSLIESLIENCHKLNFIFIGKRDGLSSTSNIIEKLARRDNVMFLENVDYHDIPHYLHRFDICLIPYLINEANIGTCPNKFVEYCAVGKPIVSTRLPGLTKFPKLAYFGSSADDFSLLFNKILEDYGNDQIRLQKKFAEDSSASNFLTEIENILNIN